MKDNIKSFNTKSDQYAKSRPRYPEDFYEYLLTLVDNRDALWDCACGNGQVSIDLVDYFNQIYATDISENQIKNAFKHQKIKYSVGPSEKTSFPNNFFDMICVAQAVHWFNLDEFFREVDRVLKPNGILAVFGYRFPKINDEVDAILDEKLHAEIDEFWSKGNRLVVSGFKGVEFPFTKVDGPKFSLNQSWSLDTMLAFFETWSAVKRYNEAHKIKITDELKKHLQLLWPEQETKIVKMNLYYYIRKK